MPQSIMNQSHSMIYLFFLNSAIKIMAESLFCHARNLLLD